MMGLGCGNRGWTPLPRDGLAIVAIYKGLELGQHGASRLARTGEQLVVVVNAVLRFEPTGKRGGEVDHSFPFAPGASTSEGDSFLRRNADITFTMLSREGLYNKIGTISTEASAACILDMLYGAYYAIDYEGHRRLALETARRVEGNRLAGAPGDMAPVPDAALR